MTKFDGKTIVDKRDAKRLTAQLHVVKEMMKDGQWRCLHEIAFSTGYPESSISARLRDLRKSKFGSYTVNRRYVSKGLFEYQVKKD